MKRLIASIAIASSAFFATTALAASKEMTEDQVKAKVEAAGYTDVHDVHKELRHWDATATKDGKEMTVDFNPRTGTVTPEKHKDKQKSGRS